VEILDGNGVVIKTVSGTITYGTTTGTFSGRFDLGTAWNTALYNIKVLTPSYLKRQLSGIQTITAGAENTTPSENMVAGDVDHDNKLTILDYNLLSTCYTFPGTVSKCSDADRLSTDLTDDGNNDEFDQNLFLRELQVSPGQ
jgi:hypothetical protein